jgi:hypothetical protein
MTKLHQPQRAARVCGAWVFISIVLLAGCGGITETFVGSDEGYLFYAADAITPPGREVTLTARLQYGTFLRDLEEHQITFLLNGKEYAKTLTGDEGIARASFRPEATGNYQFKVHAPTREKDDGQKIELADLFVACRERDVPIAVIDLDRTIVASSFKEVLMGDPQPMPDSARVLQRLAADHTLIYLTHRPDYFGTKSKRWIRNHNYPLGPLYLSEAGEFFDGSSDFKTAKLKEFRREFPNLRIGIGDKISDIESYLRVKMRPIMIVNLRAIDTTDADDLRDYADELGSLPADVDMVNTWADAEKVLYNRARFPRTAMQKKLRDMARQIELREQKAKEARDRKKD